MIFRRSLCTNLKIFRRQMLFFLFIVLPIWAYSKLNICPKVTVALYFSTAFDVVVFSLALFLSGHTFLTHSKCLHVSFFSLSGYHVDQVSQSKIPMGPRG